MKHSIHEMEQYHLNVEISYAWHHHLISFFYKNIYFPGNCRKESNENRQCLMMLTISYEGDDSK